MKSFWKHLISPFTGKKPAKTPVPAAPLGWGAAVRHAVREPSSADEGELDSISSRNGKIAHLPRPIRDRLNQYLAQGRSAVSLLPSLNQLPEVKAMLAQHFNGRPINQQNITEWKQGGYRDWLAQQNKLRQDNEFADDIRALAKSGDNLADSLFAMLTMDYARLMKNRDTESPEDFEKKRHALSILAQDIVRLHRCDLNSRRVDIQEDRFDAQKEKTKEELLHTFVEWASNPEVRKAFILAPMEHMRRLRKVYGMPPQPEDELVEKEFQNDPACAETPEPAQQEIKPKSNQSGQNQTEKSESHTGSPPQSPAQGATNSVGRAYPRAASPEGCGKLAGDNIPGIQTPITSCPGGAPETNSSPATQNPPTLDYAGKPTSQIIAEIEEQYAREKAFGTPPASEDAINPNDKNARLTASPSPASRHSAATADGGEGRGEGELNSKPITQNSSLYKPSPWDSFSEPANTPPRIYPYLQRQMSYYGPCPAPGDNWRIKTA